MKLTVTERINSLRFPLAVSAKRQTCRGTVEEGGINYKTGTTKKKGGPPHADSVSAGRRTPGLNGGQERVENVYRALMWSPEEAALRKKVTSIAVRLRSSGQGSGEAEEKGTREKLALIISQSNLSHLQPV